MSTFAIDAQVSINCFLGCEFADGIYWYTRNGNAKNASQPLFKKKTFTLPLTMNAFKVALLENIEQTDIIHHKFRDGGIDFKHHALLVVQKPKTDRKKAKSCTPIWKHECQVLPETAYFAIGDFTPEMDIVIMSIATKSHSTNVVGGSSATPSSIIAMAKDGFLAAQIEQIKLGRPLSACFGRLEFTGPHKQRIKAMTALLNLYCSFEELSNDDEILAAGIRCTASLVSDRIKDKITAIGLNAQLPDNCAVLRPDKKEKPWRRRSSDEELEEEHQDVAFTKAKHSSLRPLQSSRPNKKIKAEEGPRDGFCACELNNIADEDEEDPYCGECGGFVLKEKASIPIMCCNKLVKGKFCRVCGRAKSSSSSSSSLLVAEDLTFTTSSDEDVRIV